MQKYSNSQHVPTWYEEHVNCLYSGYSLHSPTFRWSRLL